MKKDQPNPNTTNIIIVLGGSPTGLGLVRSFGRLGCTVFLIETYKENIAQFSKYCDESFKFHYYDDPKGVNLIQFLLANKDRFRNAILIPDNDNLAMVLSRYKKELQQYFNPVVADESALKICYDKKLTFEVAEKLNISIPKTFYPKNIDDLDKADDIGFPCILKPRESYFFKKKYTKKAFLIKDKEDLRLKLNDMFTHNFEICISEIVPGDTTNLFLITFYINQNRQFIYSVLTQKIRETPPLFGSASVIKTVKMIPLLEKMAQEYTRYINYSGFGMIEFKYDKTEDTYKIIDFNPRPILFYSLFEKSRINYSEAILNDILYQKELSAVQYLTDIYWINILGDFYNYFPARNGISLREFILPYFKKKTYASFQWSDLKPFIRQIISRILYSK